MHATCDAAPSTALSLLPVWLQFKPGDRVVVQKQYVGTVRFVGDSHIGPGQWIGVELRNAST
jgi:hypothetical protein